MWTEGRGAEERWTNGRGEELSSEESEIGGLQEPEAASGLASDLPSVTTGGCRRPRDLQLPPAVWGPVHHTPTAKPAPHAPFQGLSSCPARCCLVGFYCPLSGPCHLALSPPPQRMVPPPHLSSMAPICVEILVSICAGDSKCTRQPSKHLLGGIYLLLNNAIPRNRSQADAPQPRGYVL